VEALNDDARASDVCLSVAYIGPQSRTENPRKTKIGTEVAHVTRDSDTTFKVKRSKVNLQVAGHIVAASRTACFHCVVAFVGLLLCIVSLSWYVFCIFVVLVMLSVLAK